MNKTFEQLNQELINKGMVYDNYGISDYEEVQTLHSIYDWGYILAFDCLVMPTRYDLYDNKYQLICSLDKDDDEFKIIDNKLYCKRSGFGEPYEFEYNLGDGASVHIEDIAAIGYAPNLELYDDKRFYALKDGRIYFKEDGKNLRLLQDITINDLIRQGYVLIESEHYLSNINILNDLIVTNNK